MRNGQGYKWLLAIVAVVFATYVYSVPAYANEYTDFNFAEAMVGLDVSHASSLLEEFQINNPSATNDDVTTYLKDLIKQNAIRLDRTRSAGMINYIVPENIQQMGPRTSAVFNSNPVWGVHALSAGLTANQRTGASTSPTLNQRI